MRAIAPCAEQVTPFPITPSDSFVGRRCSSANDLAQRKQHDGPLCKEHSASNDAAHSLTPIGESLEDCTETRCDGERVENANNDEEGLESGGERHDEQFNEH